MARLPAVLFAAKYPGPSNTYDPGLQEAKAVLIVDTGIGDAEVPPAMVEPHCALVGGVHGLLNVSVQFVLEPLQALPPLP